MELREGYKMTGVGMIPEDWGVKSIDEVFTFYPTANYSKAEMSFVGHVGCIHYGLIHGTDSTHLSLKEGTKFYVSNDKQKYELVEDGDIIMVDASEDLEGINKSVEVFGVNNGKYIAGLHTFLLRDTEKILANLFRGQILNYRTVKDQMLKFAVGMKVFGVSKPQVKQVLFPLPPLPEQIAIATALSDIDTLIAQTEKLIGKKKAIKQGMMQQLLSPYDAEGKLKEGWEEKTLFELADDKKELFDDGDWIESEHITTVGVRLIQTGNIGIGRFVEKDEKKYIFESSFKQLRCKLLNKNDLLICRLADPAGRACMLPDIGDNKIVTAVDVTIFRPRPEIVNRIFLVSLFSTPQWFAKIAERVGGTTHKRISRSSLGKIKIIIPVIEVQNDIAYFLSATDKELLQLEIKIGKLHSLKQSMMQSLLTGKIRIYKSDYEPATQV